MDNKIPSITGLATKTELTVVEGKIPDVAGYVKKSGYATEITSIKNDYATNASLDSKLNDLKAQHIAVEVKKVGDKVKKNASDILGFESRLKQKEDIVDEGQEGEDSFHRGFQKYLQERYVVYECRTGSFNFSNGRISKWKSMGIFNYLGNSDLNVSSSASVSSMPVLENNGRMNVNSDGYYFVQSKVIHPNANKIVNIYIVYRLDPISKFRSTDYTIQNALFGTIKVTNNATGSSNNKYEGYGICFDEGGTFSKGGTTNGRNVIIFGADMSFSTNATNKVNNNIYVLGDFLVQGINRTSI